MSRPRARGVSLLFLGALACGEPEATPWCGALEPLCRARPVFVEISLDEPKTRWVDLDDDGNLDLIASSRRSGVGLRWGGDAGAESGMRHWLWQRGAAGVSAVDLDGDSGLDLLVAVVDPPGLVGLIHDGERGFREQTLLAAESIVGQPRHLWVGALGGSSAPDVVIALSTPGALEILYDPFEDAVGSGTAASLTLGVDVEAVEVVDLDHDGGMELLAIDRSKSALFVAKGGLGGWEVTEYATVLLPEALHVVDLDGDGFEDVFVNGRAREMIWCHENDRAGGLLPAKEVALAASGAPGLLGVLAEVGPEMSGWVITGKASEVAASCILGAGCEGRAPAVRALAQPVQRIERDGARAVSAGSAAAITRVDLTLDRLGMASLGVQEEVVLLTSPFTGLVSTDLDGDGWPDVVVSARRSEEPGGLALLIGSASGLAQARSWVLDRGIEAMVPASGGGVWVLDGDGALGELLWEGVEATLRPADRGLQLGVEDLVGGLIAFGGALGDELLVPVWSKQTGLWRIERVGLESTAPAPVDVEIVAPMGQEFPSGGALDLNGDGLSDGVLHWPEGALIVVWGAGLGEPRAAERLEWPARVQSITTAGLEGGPAKLIIVDNDGVHVAEAATQGLVKVATLAPPRFSERRVAFADFDGDGLADLLSEYRTGRVELEVDGSDGGWPIPLTVPGSPWSYATPLRLDIDQIMDVVALEGGRVVTRRSGGQARAQAGGA
jgi:hypothetical protein